MSPATWIWTSGKSQRLWVSGGRLGAGTLPADISRTHAVHPPAVICVSVTEGMGCRDPAGYSYLTPDTQASLPTSFWSVEEVHKNMDCYM